MSLDLLVVLELGLEEPHHLDRTAGRPGNGDRGVLVSGEDLFDAAVRNDVALGRAPVPATTTPLS